jgi:signal transduction histidine kinase
MLGFLLGETDRLNRLVSVLLDCARPRPPCFRPHRLHEIIQRVLELLAMQARNRNIRLEREFGATSDLLFCDEEQMVQVLLNLLMNPLQILSGGGEIVVRTRRTATELILEVDDDGPGIPEEQRKRVFDPFFTQREGGIGLGLTVAQQIVRAHGATLVAEASPQGGARFRIAFPDSPPEPTETSRP